MKKLTLRPVLKISAAFTLLLILCGRVSAQLEPSDSVKALCITQPEACEINSRLTAFEPNYVIWQATDDDEDALEVHYSFRYMLTRPHCMEGSDFIYRYSEDESKECIKNFQDRWELYFAYTGEFDFYAGTRRSGPVINRISNPGLHYRRYFPGRLYKWLDLSIEHRSNGQVTEIDETDAGILKTQTAFDTNDHVYFDSISRGANFYKLEAKFEAGDSASFYVSVKSYIDHDSAVNWGPDAVDNPSIADYDRVRFVYTDSWIAGRKEIETSFEWLIGDEGAKTDSFDLDIMYPIELGKLALPSYIRLHKGPMNTLSNYTLEQDTIGIGFKLKQF